MRESLRNILLPFSALYGGAVFIRNLGYDNGMFKVRKLPVPVVSVGNISVGGSGKTPFTMFLVEKLLAMGKRPAVLSRGYKRLTNELVVSCPGRGDDPDVQMIGDEPALISMYYPDVPVAVHADRHRAGLEVLSKYGADVFVLDDGLQNRELHRDLDFVLLRYQLPELADFYLPAGDLRDSKRRMRQADVLVVTAHGAAEMTAAAFDRLGRYSGAPVAGVNYFATDLFDCTGTHYSFDSVRGKRVVAFCGIANAERFFDGVDALLDGTAARKKFRDHHWYDEYDLDEIFEGEDDIVAVTTAKDAVRIFQDEELSKVDEARRIFAVGENTAVNFGEAHIDDALNGIFGKVYA